MTQDEIIRMAREAGFDVDEGLFPFEATEDKYIGTERVLERFAALVAAHEREKFKSYVEEVSVERDCAVLHAVLAEREACAKVCEEGVDTEHPIVKGHIMKNFGISEHLAAAIRARSEK